jgi:outer membrane murein-binding lipoprotein Lpp
MRRRLAAAAMAACVLLSGCSVLDKVDDAKHAKKQAQDVQHKLNKDLNKGQDY